MTKCPTRNGLWPWGLAPLPAGCTALRCFARWIRSSWWMSTSVDARHAEALLDAMIKLQNKIGQEASTQGLLKDRNAAAV